MTREEAKNWLTKLYAKADITDEYGDVEDMQPYEEAVDMAIEALEQEETIPFDFELFQAGLMNMPDGMTNGDAIKAMFPNANIWGHNYMYMEDEVYLHKFDADWWNAPYKAESEDIK